MYLFPLWHFCSNDDDIDDEDTNEESSLKSKPDDGAEPSPGPSAASDSQQMDVDGAEEAAAGDDKTPWPTITDLNTRLRRVITSYQRSFRKEEQKMQTTTKATKVSDLNLSVFDINFLFIYNGRNVAYACLNVSSNLPER